MPVLKVPVVHKFGIISHCQRLHLQSRLLSDLNSVKSDVGNNAVKRNSNQFEITDEFVEKYNFTISSSENNNDERKRMKDMAQKFYLKIKRRTGLQHNCENETHINLALAWTELAILSQCNDDISTKSLDLLCISLSIAPISHSTFFVQFYLLETCLYYLQTTVFQSNNLQKHVKWLQIGELVALRIYIQIKLQISQCQKENLDNLKIYTKDLKKCEKNFDKFPEASISFCVINELIDHLTSLFDETSTDTKLPISEHDISSLLWHCVDLWRCSFYSVFHGQINESLEGIKYCLMNNSSFGKWIDCYLSFRVLANIASFEKVGLDIFQSVILGLSEVNAEMEMKNKDDTNQTDAETNSSFNEKICGLEKGTILLFAAIREMACLPLLCRISEERERSLSTIAEFMLHSEGSLGKLPLVAKQIIALRLKTILEVLDSSDVDSKLYVMKNAVWLLLETIQRKRILKGTLEDCLQYGKIISSTVISSDLPTNPDFINARLSLVIAQKIFPVLQSSPLEESPVNEATVIKTIPRLDKQKERKIKNDNKVKVNAITKKPIINQTTAYIRQSDKKLNKILQNNWDSELPRLEKSIEELNTPIK